MRTKRNGHEHRGPSVVDGVQVAELVEIIPTPTSLLPDLTPVTAEVHLFAHGRRPGKGEATDWLFEVGDRRAWVTGTLWHAARTAAARYFACGEQDVLDVTPEVGR